MAQGPPSLRRTAAERADGLGAAAGGGGVAEGAGWGW